MMTMPTLPMLKERKLVVLILTNVKMVLISAMLIQHVIIKVVTTFASVTMVSPFLVLTKMITTSVMKQPLLNVLIWMNVTQQVMANGMSVTRMLTVPTILVHTHVHVNLDSLVMVGNVLILRNVISPNLTTAILLTKLVISKLYVSRKKVS